jgi:phosphatidylserine decarboxylase
MTVATYAAAQLLRVLPRTRITRAVGRLCDARLPAAVSTAVVGLYARAYRVALEDTAEPDGAWGSFDDFFTRGLRDGARPLDDDADAVVSPADGRIEAIGTVERGGRFLIKGRDYTVAELVGDAAEGERYVGGQFAVVYLSPRDYHRVHAPVGGTISLVRSMPGDLYPVNAIGERHVPSLFARNRRVAIVIDPVRNGAPAGDRGRVTVVMVGAMIVGRITVTGVDGRDVPLGTHVLSPPRVVARGDEIGMFHLGSTAAVFVEKGAAPRWTATTGPIRMGRALSPGGRPSTHVETERAHGGGGNP